MTDRELLEAAAKAVGGTFSEGTGKRRTGETWDTWEWYGPIGILMPTGCVAFPLTDDGDALRLAVKLQLSVAFKSLPHAVYVEVGSGSASSAIETLADVRFEVSDHYAATRRAIVRAAAAIGKEMP